MTPEQEWARRKVRSLLGSLFVGPTGSDSLALWNAAAETVLQEMVSIDDAITRNRFGALLYELSVVAGYLANGAAKQNEGASGADMVAAALEMSAALDGFDELQVAQVMARRRQQ